MIAAALAVAVLAPFAAAGTTPDIPNPANAAAPTTSTLVRCTGMSDKDAIWVVDDLPVRDQAPGLGIDALVDALRRRGCNAVRASLFDAKSKPARAVARVGAINARLRLHGPDAVVVITRSDDDGGARELREVVTTLAQLPLAIDRVVEAAFGPTLPESPPPRKTDASASTATQGRVTTSIRKGGQIGGGGELPKEHIVKVINQHIGEIQYCYESQLKKQPGMAGRVVMRFTVDVDGRMKTVETENVTLPSIDAVECMKKKMQTWRFPKPAGGPVEITFPFVFNTI